MDLSIFLFNHVNIREMAVLFFKSLHKLNPETRKTVLYNQVANTVGSDSSTIRDLVHRWNVNQVICLYFTISFYYDKIL